MKTMLSTIVFVLLAVAQAHATLPLANDCACFSDGTTTVQCRSSFTDPLGATVSACGCDVAPLPPDGDAISCTSTCLPTATDTTCTASFALDENGSHCVVGCTPVGGCEENGCPSGGTCNTELNRCETPHESAQLEDLPPGVTSTTVPTSTTTTTTVPATTTTTPEATSTTVAPTTTTAPTSTSTLPPTTTTVPVTTTTVEVTTTLAPTTTVAPTTSTVPQVTTTLAPTTTVPATTTTTAAPTTTFGVTTTTLLVDCGNQIVEPGEECDTGGQSKTCDDDCTLPACGDGIRNAAAGEPCDGDILGSCRQKGGCVECECAEKKPCKGGHERSHNGHGKKKGHRHDDD